MKLHFLLYLKVQGLSLQASLGGQHFCKTALKPESTVLGDLEAAVPGFTSLCAGSASLTCPSCASHASSVLVVGMGSWRERARLQLPWSHPHPDKVVIAKEEQFVLGSCTGVLKLKEKEKGQAFNESAHYWATHALGASLSGQWAPT